MPTTISLPTHVTSNDVNANRLFLANGVFTDGAWNTLHPDIRLSDFNSLSIPLEATIGGIEIVLTGKGNTQPNSPSVKVYNGSGWSNNISLQGSLSKANNTFDPGWGSSSNLWGLTWTNISAQNIMIEIDSSTILPLSSRIFWDHLLVRITYSIPPLIAGGNIILPLGRIIIPQGKVIL